MNRKGDLYGTTVFGGNGGGVVFKLGSNGVLTVLHAFAGGNDGSYPEGPLVFDGQGNLYGTTSEGGGQTNCGITTGCGTVFKIGGDGTETVLYSFCQRGKDCADGAEPWAPGLVVDSNANLYGTTNGGGDSVCKCGTVFRLAPDGTETVLHAFTGTNGDGLWPHAGVIFDRQGNLYGTTFAGGNGGGTVFEVAPNGAETIVYPFCSEYNCTDGSNPGAGVFINKRGVIYGTTSEGGGNSFSGVVFKIKQKAR